MRAERARKKKLIVAFHFQFSNPSGWNCDACRKAGLEIKRRCGWVPAALLTEARPVWTRRNVFTDECPKSTVDAQSLAWIELYSVWKRLGTGPLETLGAREVEAFLILEKELVAEKDAQQNTTKDLPAYKAPRPKC